MRWLGGCSILRVRQGALDETKVQQALFFLRVISRVATVTYLFDGGPLRFGGTHQTGTIGFYNMAQGCGIALGTGMPKGAVVRLMLAQMSDEDRPILARC